MSSTSLKSETCPIEKSSYSFALGELTIWKTPSSSSLASKNTDESKKDSPTMKNNESTSEDTSSQDGSEGYYGKMLQLFKGERDQFSAVEFDSRVGLNCSQIHSTFQCLLDSGNKRFYVWLGDMTIDKLTKSSFLNLANFAEERFASKMILILNRDHFQKNEFKRLFKVLDAKRVGKKGMKELYNED